MAMLGASLGSQEVLGMGAAGGQYGLASVGFFVLGSIPAIFCWPPWFSCLFITEEARGAGPAGVAPQIDP